MTMTEKTTSLWKNFIAGGCSGITSTVTSQPFDTVKVLLQTQPVPQPGQKPVYAGAIECCLKTIRNDGFLALYRGMSVPIILSSPVFAVSFFGFNLGKRLQQSDPEETLATVQIFTAGMLSGIFASTLLTPGERIKCLLQVQTTNAGPKLYNSPIDVARDLYRRGGIKTFYKGFGATLARDIPGLGVYYLTYTMMRDVLSSEIGDIDLSPLQILIAGGVAGVLSWIVSIPTDVMKSRIQTAPEGKYPHGMRSVFVDLMRHEGPSALFKGTVPMLLRAFPSSAVSFLGYEGAMNLLTCLAHDE